MSTCSPRIIRGILPPGDPNRPVARSDGYFRFHLSGTLAYRHYHVDILAVLKDDDA